MTLLDIFKISEFQTVSDFHFCVGNIWGLGAISTCDVRGSYMFSFLKKAIAMNLKKILKLITS